MTLDGHEVSIKESRLRSKTCGFWRNWGPRGILQDKEAQCQPSWWVARPFARSPVPPNGAETAENHRTTAQVGRRSADPPDGPRPFAPRCQIASSGSLEGWNPESTSDGLPKIHPCRCPRAGRNRRYIEVWVGSGRPRGTSTGMCSIAELNDFAWPPMGVGPAVPHLRVLVRGPSGRHPFESLRFPHLSALKAKKINTMHVYIYRTFRRPTHRHP